MKMFIILFFSFWRLIPHFLFLILTPRTNYFWGDFKRWKEILLPQAQQGHMFVPFLTLMTMNQEFRNLFYYRLGWISRPLRILCRPMDTLYINTKDIGPGLYIHHGFATVISAKKLGNNCWVNQQVTIGFSGKGETPPEIGDNVRVSCGAKVLGPLKIGSNVKIGANAVVVKDVPDNVTVVGVPARIVTRNGVRVDEKL